MKFFLALLAAQKSLAALESNVDDANEVPAVLSSLISVSPPFGNHASGSLTSGAHTAVLGVNTADTSPTTVPTIATSSSVLSMAPPIPTTVSPITPVSRVTLQRTLNVLPLRREDYSMAENGMDSKYAGTNIICDSYELYHKCVRPPYLAHCDPDCALDTFRHVMMAEPHEESMNPDIHDTSTEGNAGMALHNVADDCQLATYFREISLIVPAGHLAVGFTELQISENASEPLQWCYSFTQMRLGKWKGVDSPFLTFTQGVMVLIDRIPERGLVCSAIKVSLETTVVTLLRADGFVQAAMGTVVKTAVTIATAA